MSQLPGVFQAKKKDGSIYYRSSITYSGKHISLGSYLNANDAHLAYLEANQLFTSDTTLDSYKKTDCLSFEKQVCIINFRDNHVYFKNPIYLKKSFFYYYLSPEDILIFDVEDLFFYARHKIMRRGGHLFVADYGMQLTITGRYGIKPYGVKERDYRFINGNPNDFRYENIEILNTYHGVVCVEQKDQHLFQARIHVNGNLIIGVYPTAIEAAIAYNKAIDFLKKAGITKNYMPNYIDDMSGSNYASVYTALAFSKSFQTYLDSLYL